MSPILANDLYKYLTLAVMLLAILFGYRTRPDVGSADNPSRGWTYVPLIAFAIASIGPSAFAIMIYLGYKFGVLQPPAAGYRFSTFIGGLPVEFAIMNWPFVALSLTCRLGPNAGSARSAMWGSVVAMSLPNILLFCTAWDMVSNVFDAGQGIGFIQAMLMLPVITMIWPSPFAGMSDAGLSVISTLTGPVPILGLVGWLVGRLIGSALQQGEPVRR